MLDLHVRGNIWRLCRTSSWQKNIFQFGLGFAKRCPRYFFDQKYWYIRERPTGTLCGLKIFLIRNIRRVVEWIICILTWWRQTWHCLKGSFIVFVSSHVTAYITYTTYQTLWWGWYWKMWSNIGISLKTDKTDAPEWSIGVYRLPSHNAKRRKIIGLTVGPELQSNVYIKSLFASSSHAWKGWTTNSDTWTILVFSS